MMEVTGRSRSHSTTSTLSSLVNSTRTPLETHVSQFEESLDPALTPSHLPVQQKSRPPSPQDFLHPSSSSSFSATHHQQTDLHQPCQTDQTFFSYPADPSLTYNIHFNPSPLFSVSSSIQYAAPSMPAQPKSPFAGGSYNSGLPGLSPSSQHMRPVALPSSESAQADARRGPPTPLPFTHPYSAGYYISTGLTPIYTATQFRPFGGDPFFGAVSHLTPTPSRSSFEAAQQEFGGAFAAMHRPLSRPEPVSMAVRHGQEQSGVESALSPVKIETQDVSCATMSHQSKDASSGEQVQEKPDASPAVSPVRERQQSVHSQRQLPVNGPYSMATSNGQRELPRPPINSTAHGPMAFDYPVPQTYNHMTSGHSVPINPHHRLPSAPFHAPPPVFAHPSQTYSVFFGPDGQAHYVANAMPQAIADINGNLTYAYPPQAFQPAQAMPHHAWARQQNAFAYHYAEDMDMDEPTPEHRHSQSVASPYRNASRSPAARHSAREEDVDASGEDDDEEDLPLPPVSLKRSRSLSPTSVSEASVASEVEWQPRRKSAKKASTSSRKAVDTKRSDGRKALQMLEAEQANDGYSGKVRYTSNAEDKQTDKLKRECFTCRSRDPPSWRRSCLNYDNILCNRCGIYEKTHGVARPLPLDEISNPPARLLVDKSKKRKKSVKELGLKSLHISNSASSRVNAVNVNTTRDNAENHASRGFSDEDSGNESETDRRVSLNSNKSGHSAGVASTASELTASTFGPQTPLSGHEISPRPTTSAAPRAKASAIVKQSTTSAGMDEMLYRTFTRPMSVPGKRGLKPYPGVTAQGKAGKAKNRAARPTHQRKRSARHDE